MQLGSTYLIVNDFEKSISFYENFLQIPVSHRNMDRFAVFAFKGGSIALMNGHFDANNPDKVIYKGTYSAFFDDLQSIALAPNTRKFVLNFITDDLEKELERVKALNISDRLTGIKYICNVSPYYYFQLTDPDGNVIEVTGNYTPDTYDF